MISPQLFEFFTEKTVRGISLGVSQEEIKMKLGEADDFALLGKRHKTLIYKYGQVEFYFELATCFMIQFTWYNPFSEEVFWPELAEILHAQHIEYEVFPNFTSIDQTCYLTSNEIYIILDVDSQLVKKVYLKTPVI